MLSERGQAILRQVGTRLSEGYTPGEIGRELGISKSSVLGLVDELRTELERLALPR
jgi:DNA-binding CsgD family transcriptional regulator